MISGQTDISPARQKALQSAKNASQELGFSCAQTVLSAQRGQPPSAIVVVALPFSCYGQALSAKDLPGFAAGISGGLKQTFSISGAVDGAYTLGGHRFWIERALAAPKDHPESSYTLEIACSILKKSAACWMTLAVSAGALRDFEDGLVSLDGEPPVDLVPMDAFIKKAH